MLRALPWALAGVVAGAVFLDRLDDRFMRPVIGWIILAILAVHVWRRYRTPHAAEGAAAADHPARRHLFAAFMGSMGGFTTMVANAAGPVMGMYFLALRLSKATFLGTSAWYFMVLNWCKVPFMMQLGLINSDSLAFNIKLSPAILVGGLLGIYFSSRLSNSGFNRLIQVLTVLAALKLLF